MKIAKPMTLQIETNSDKESTMICSISQAQTAGPSVAGKMPKSGGRAWTFFIFGLAFLLPRFSAAAEITFTPLGLFGGTRSEAYDVSADGSVVVGTTDSGVFHWTSAGSTTQTAIQRDRAAVSDDGFVVVGSHFMPGSGIQAFRWTVGGQFQRLGGLSGELPDSAAFGTSGDGSVVVGYGTTANGQEAVRWTQASGITSLARVPGSDEESIAFAISDDGTIVVGSRGPSVLPEAFRWTPQTGMVGLGVLPGAFASVAHGISPDGSVIVGENRFPSSLNDQRYEASFWTEAGGWVSLGDLPGGRISSIAYDVSADGSAIVGSGQTTVTSGPLIRAFYWTPQSGMVNFQDLLVSLGVNNLDGWTLHEARGISHDGRTVVGWGTHNGRTEAWIATIPEPSTIVLAGLAVLLILAIYLWRSRRVMYYSILK